MFKATFIFYAELYYFKTFAVALDMALVVALVLALAQVIALVAALVLVIAQVMALVVALVLALFHHCYSCSSSSWHSSSHDSSCSSSHGSLKVSSAKCYICYVELDYAKFCGMLAIALAMSRGYSCSYCNGSSLYCGCRCS
jgi:hypothetical protein